MKNKQTKITPTYSEKFINSVSDLVKNADFAGKMSYKELADYLIYHYPENYKFGSKQEAVLDRVIQELFNLAEQKELNKPYQPDRSVEAPESEYLTEGFDPSKIKNYNV